MEGMKDDYAICTLNHSSVIPNPLQSTSTPCLIQDQSLKHQESLTHVPALLSDCVSLLFPHVGFAGSSLLRGLSPAAVTGSCSPVPH